MKTLHNLNIDMHAHDCIFIPCEVYPLFNSFEIYPPFHSFETYLPFHSYEVYPPFHFYAHALCFTIQTLYSYSLKIMIFR
jgi:hypothetical protein